MREPLETIVLVAVLFSHYPQRWLSGDGDSGNAEERMGSHA